MILYPFEGFDMTTTADNRDGEQGWNIPNPNCIWHVIYVRDDVPFRQARYWSSGENSIILIPWFGSFSFEMFTFIVGILNCETISCFIMLLLALYYSYL